MTNPDIAARRIHNQHLGEWTFATPAEAVAWFGAMQAQDYLGALWAIGTRTGNVVESDVERALAERAIVRTWPLRGTLHFVAAQDARWMLDLLGPRLLSGHRARLEREHGLDEAVLKRSRLAARRALEGERQLTRDELYVALEKKGIATGRQRGLQIVWILAHEGLICFGPRHGKQQTFVLLDEWLPRSSRETMPREQALAELARRYFTSHGPATIADCAWWSGLTISEVKSGLRGATEQLSEEVIDDEHYWLARDRSPEPATAGSLVQLLPAYDELTVAYKNRSAILDPKFPTNPTSRGLVFDPIVVVNGLVAGTWKRVLRGNAVSITATMFRPLTRIEKKALGEAGERYGQFVGAIDGIETAIEFA